MDGRSKLIDLPNAFMKSKRFSKNIYHQDIIEIRKRLKIEIFFFQGEEVLLIGKEIYATEQII